MGLRIIDKRKDERTQRRARALQDKLIEVEVKKWSYGKEGDFEKLHKEFLDKIQLIRSQFCNNSTISHLADELKSQIKTSDKAVHTKTAVDLRTLLDLL